MAFLISTICISLSIADADPVHREYDWDNQEEFMPLSAKDSSEPELILKDFLSYEYNYDEEGDFTRYVFRHKAILVNSDESIERNNRIYLPLGQDKDIFRQEARVVRPDGTIIEMNEENIKEAIDESTDRIYKYFALDGLVKGSIVEYLYLVNTSPTIAGSRVILQDEYPSKESTFEIISPKHLVVGTKSYNGFSDLTEDTSYYDRTVIRGTTYDIPAAREEPYALFEPNLQQVAYKITENLFTGAANMFQIQELAYHWINNNLADINKGILKKVKKLSKKIKIPKEANQFEKIASIENYIKLNFQTLDVPLAELDDLNYILNNKAGGEDGMLILYSLLFDELEVPYQFVFTCNRYEKRFDPEFESYHYIDEDLLYFPEIDEYVVPSDITSRIGLIPAFYSNNFGAFFKPEKTKDDWLVKTTNKLLPADSYLESTDSFRLHADLRKDLENPVFTVNQELTGHNAQTIQIIADYLEAEEVENLLEGMVKNLNTNADLDTFYYKNIGVDAFRKIPLILNSAFTSQDFTSAAGDKTLLKIGELIGPQVEMYQQGERQFDVDTDYNHLYYRELKVDIPEGYSFKNLDKLNMDFHDKEKTMRFVSKYELNENSLTVRVSEFYSKIHYPKSMFETFRSVINAAADFNKITIVIEPN